MGKRVELVTEFKVVYIPLPPERAAARRTGLLLLMQWIKEDLSLNPEGKVSNEVMDANRDGDDGRVRDALFPLENVAERKRTPASRGIYAWVIGHDGSAHRMALGAWRS